MWTTVQTQRLMGISPTVLVIQRGTSMRGDESNKDIQRSQPDAGDFAKSQQQGDNLSSFLQNITSKDFQEALLAQNVTDRGIGGGQAYCDATFNRQHLVVRFTPGFDPRQHANENNAQNVVYLEPQKGQDSYYNCIVNCHYNAKGELVGTPAHAQVNPYNNKVECYIPPNTPEVTFKNHIPKPNANKTAQA